MFLLPHVGFTGKRYKDKPILGAKTSEDSISWLLAPALFILATWIFFIAPDATERVVPSFGFGGVSKTLRESLPLYPTSFHEAYELGVWATELQNGGDEARILANATAVFQRNVSRDDILRVEQYILQMQNDGGVITRVNGIFSFVNFIWLFSIIGIMCVMIPFLGFVLSPVMEILTHFFHYRILPVFIIFEANHGLTFLAFLICFWFEVQGQRYPSETGFYVSITGCLLAIPAWSYAARHAWDAWAKSKEHQDLVLSMGSCVFLFLVWFPMAILYDSTFLGFLALACFYHAMGFSIQCFGVCWSIGFEDESSLTRVLYSSAIIIIACILLKCFGLTRHPYFSPFSTAFNTLGPLTYFLGLLISSNACYNAWNENKKNKYLFFNGIMIASLAFVLAFSFPLNIVPLRNTGLVFTALYAVEKIVECNIWSGGRFVVGLMLFFIVLWRVSLFLHSHPDFITVMFDSSWISASN